MAVVGSAEVVIRAVSRMKEDIRKNLASAAADADDQGSEVGESFGKGFAARMRERVMGALDFSSLQAAAFNEGDAFGQNFTSGVANQGEQAGTSWFSRFRTSVSTSIGSITSVFDDLSSISNAYGGQAGLNWSSSFNANTSGVGTNIQTNLAGAQTAAGGSGGRAGTAFANAFANSASAGSGRGGFLGAFTLKLLAFIPVIAAAVAALSSLVSGLFAVASAAAVAATGGLAILPGLIGGLVAAVATGILAFGGIGEAVKELGQEQANTAKLTQQHARQQRNAARQIRNAQEGVVEAQERVVEAQRRVREAIEDLARTRRDTERDSAAAIRATREAEERLAEAQEDAQRAQESLTDARAAATERLEDLQLALRGAVLSEEEAVLRLERARERYNKTNADSEAGANERAQARIDLQQAELALDQARDRREDVTKQTQEANRAGVEGSDEVVAARERIDDANERVRDAEQSLADARTRQADQAVANAERIEDAQQRVARAHEGVSDAIRGVRNAQEALAEAQAANAEATAAHTKALEDQRKKFNELSPAAQNFALFLVTIKDKVKELREQAATGMLPGVQEMLTALTNPTAFDVFKNGIRTTGTALGQVAAQFGKTFTTPDALKDLESFFKTNRVVIRDFGTAFIEVMRGLLDLTAALGPDLEDFSGYIRDAAVGFRQFVDDAQKTGKLRDFMDLAKASAIALKDALGAVFGLVADLALIAAPFGIELLESFTGATNGMRDFVQSAEGKERIQEFFENVLPNVEALTSLIGELILAFLRLGENPAIKEIADTLRTDLIPVLEDFINNVLTNFGPQIADIVVDIARFFNAMSESDILKGFVNVVRDVIDAIAELAELPYGNEILAFFAVFAIGATGAAKLTKTLGPVAGAARAALKGVLSLGGGLLGIKTPPKAGAANTALNGIGRAARSSSKAVLDLIKNLGSKVLAGGAATAGAAGKVSGRLRGGPGGKDAGFLDLGKAGRQAGKQAAGATDDVGKAAAKNAGKVGLLGKAFGVIGRAATLATGPVGIVIAIIALLVVGLVTLYKRSETFRRIVNGAMKGVGDAFSAMWDIAKRIFAFFGEYIGVVVGQFRTFGSAISRVVGYFTDWDRIKRIASDVVGAVVGFFTALPGRIGRAVSGLGAFFARYFREVGGDMSRGASAAIAAVVGFFSGMGRRIGDAARSVGGAVAGFARTIASGIGSGVSTAFDNVVGFFRGLPARITGFVRSIGDAARSVGSAVWTNIRDGVVNAAKTVGDIGKGLFNGLVGLINRYVIDGINNTLHFEVDPPGPLPKFQLVPDNVKIPRIPRLAEGATVLPRQGGTLAVLAEAGRAESVVDTGVLNRRLRDLEGVGDLAILAGELRRQTALLERLTTNQGLTIEQMTVQAAPGEQAAVSVPRSLRTLAFELGA